MAAAETSPQQIAATLSPLELLRLMEPVVIPARLQKPEYRFCRVGWTIAQLRSELSNSTRQESVWEQFKRPHGEGWQKKPMSYDHKYLEAWLATCGNYGIIAGSVHEFEDKKVTLFITDCDDTDAFAGTHLWDDLPLETLKVKTGRGPIPGGHIYYRTDLKSKKAHVELPGYGHFKFFKSQCVGPGSLHPSGRRYEISVDADPAYVDAETLAKILIETTKALCPDKLDSIKSALEEYAPTPHGSRLEDNVAKLEELKKKRIGQLNKDEKAELKPCMQRLTDGLKEATEPVRFEDLVSFEGKKGEGEHAMRLAWATALILSGYTDDELQALCSHFDDYNSNRTQQQQLDSVRGYVKEGGKFHKCLKAYIPGDWCTDCPLTPLNELADKVKDDPHVMAKPNVLKALAALKRENSVEFGILIDSLKLSRTAKTEAKKAIDRLLQRPVEERAGKCIDIFKVRDLKSQATFALEALEEYNNPPQYFVKGGIPCRVKDNKIMVLDSNALLGVLAKAANWTEGESLCYPPPLLAKVLTSTGDFPFPELKGITNVPIMHGDGTVNLEPGYDSMTKYYYVPRDGFKLEIPDKPTADDAKNAAKYIMDEVFVDFPFIDDVSKAHALAATLTPVLRSMVKGQVPMYVVTKPLRGTGATLICKLVYRITCDEVPDLTQLPESKSEMEKKVVAMLMEGKQVIIFDNEDDRVSNKVLDSILTTPRYTSRLLGHSKSVTVENNVAWYLTGNNVQIGGDLGRRVYFSEMDAEEPQPWLRKNFKHPEIETWVEEHRSEIVSAIYTMARAWVLAGKPEAKTPSLGSYSEWCYVIGGILEYSGVNGFLGNIQKQYVDLDAESEEWETFFDWWSRNPVLSGKQKANDVFNAITQPDSNGVRRANPHVQLPKKIAEAIPKGATAVGIALRSQKKVRYKNGLVFKVERDEHANANVYFVEVYDEQRRLG